jgi:hypothetical protein
MSEKILSYYSEQDVSDLRVFPALCSESFAYLQKHIFETNFFIKTFPAARK